MSDVHFSIGALPGKTTNMRSLLLAVTAMVVALLFCPIQAVDAGDDSFDQPQQMQQTLRQLAASMDDSSSASTNGSMTPVQKQRSSSDATIQPNTTDSSSNGVSSTTIIIIAAGFAVTTSLAILLAVVRRNRRKQEATTNNEAPPGPPSNHPRLKGIDMHVAVLGDDADYRKKRELSQLESDACNSWAEASAATSSYSIAPLSSRHIIPARPVCIYTPARVYDPEASIAASELSSHTDDYSIGMLESPVSTEYSFGSEEDDVFPSSPWDEVDSYRSLDSTFLSTTSSDVFESNRSRSGNAWKQVHRPSRTPSISSTMQPAPSGVLFVRQLNPHNMGRMHLDPRGRGRGHRMRFDVEV